MSEINEMMMISDEMLNSIGGGVLPDESRAIFQTVTQQLKGSGFSFNSVVV